MKSHKDKELIIALLFIGLFAGFSGRIFETLSFPSPTDTGLNQATAILATQENIVSKEPIPPTVTLGFVGDIMLSRGIAQTVTKKLNGDYFKLFEHMEILKEPDIMFGNLEGPVSDQGSDKRNLYSFRMDPIVIDVLHEAGFDVLSFANNHVGDWRKEAFEDTLLRLKAGGILACGAGMTKAEAEAPAIIVQEKFRIGFLCFSDVGPVDYEATETTSGILLANDPDFAGIVSRANAQVDALIVSFHFGNEYETVHNTRQEALAKQAIDNGAVLVVGAHPHVAQDIGTYKDAPILYSLGNFIFDQNFSKDTSFGHFATAMLTGKKVSNVVPHKVVFDKNFVPSFAQ